MSLQIIGVGWGRTGTLSLKKALEILGFGPCYHMTELIKNPDDVYYWQQAISGETVNWDTLFHGYRSAVDYPSCQHWESIGTFFHNAKYILTLRDADSWYDSVKSTIFSAKPNLLGQFKILLRLPFSAQMRKRLEVFRFIEKSIWEMDFDGKFEDRVYSINKYNKNIDAIKAAIGNERLLVFDVKSGWNPLCDFLSVDVPTDVPFPSLNKRDQFDQMIRRYF